MRSTVLAATTFVWLPVLAATPQAPPTCTIKLDSTYQLVAPPGWQFLECASVERGAEPIFRLEPVPPQTEPPTPPEDPGLRLYGGNAGRGTVEGALATDREFYSTEFAPKDGEGLRTGDKRDVRVLHFTRRAEPFAWVAHGFFKVGPGVFWVAYECDRVDQCEANYSAFEYLVAAIRVSRPNEFNGR